MDPIVKEWIEEFMSAPVNEERVYNEMREVRASIINERIWMLGGDEDEEPLRIAHISALNALREYLEALETLVAE